MKKENFFKIEYVIFLFPISIFAPNFSNDHFLFSRIRLEHIFIVIFFFYLIVNFIKDPWLPKLKILSVVTLLCLHVLYGLVNTDFSSGDIRPIKFLGYIENYLSFILAMLCIDYYCMKHPKKIKQTLNRLIKNIILSSFVTASLILIILITYKNKNFYMLSLFSADVGMYARAYNVGRYLGPFAMPIEAGFYSALGMFLVFYSYQFRLYKNKFLITFSFLVFNLIGIASGSKVYILGLIILFITMLVIFFRTRKKIYRSFLIFITLFQMIMVFFSTIFISPSYYEKKIYILKYYDLKNYNSLGKMIAVISGGRINYEVNKKNEEDFSILVKKILDHDIIIDNQDKLLQLINENLNLSKNEKKYLFSELAKKRIIQMSKKDINDVLLNKEFSPNITESLLIIKGNKLNYFDYQGAFDSQHKMIKSHGGNISLIFLISFYIWLFMSAIKIYFANNVLGFFLISLSLLLILTSTGFPIFFSNIMFFFNCIIIYSLLMINSNKIKLYA